MTDNVRRRRVLSLAATVAFAASTVALFVVSRGKWSDALVDSGNVWMVPFTVSQGELLYRDIVYWFGPFTPYFHGSVFRFLGPTFRTLVVAGVIGSVGTIAVLFYALRRVTSRVEALLWSALAVPALVFMPNSGGSILGMGYRMWHAATFAMLAVAAISRVGPRGPLVTALASGILSALAGLCRTEWGIAALLSSLLALGAREPFKRAWLRDALVAGTAALVLFGGVLGLFVLSAGAAAVLTDGPILLFGLPDETRQQVALAGLRSWRSGVVPLLYSALMWIGVVFAVEIVALRREDPERARKRLAPLFAILGFLAVLAVVAGGSGAVLFSAAPLVCLTSFLVRLRRLGSPEAPAMAGFGLLGLLVSHRAFFHISDGPYVAPPLLIAFVCAAGLLRLFVTRERLSASDGLRRGLLVVMAALTFLAFAGRAFQYLSDDRVPVPGTQGMLSARRDTAREIVELAALIRRETHEGDGLVVFPEGEVLNYLSGRANPIRHKLYLPGYVNAGNERRIVAELEGAGPASVVVWKRPLGEYGAGSFGPDYAREIRAWIDRNYVIRSHRASGPPASSPFEHYVRRASAR